MSGEIVYPNITTGISKYELNFQVHVNFGIAPVFLCEGLSIVDRLQSTSGICLSLTSDL